ncbi:MAG: GIY-YIG nuclease family protein [Patescibacteria group bacterium]
MSVRHYYVYIMANNRPTLYVGVTNNLGRRVFEHTHELFDGFTKQYKLTKLVYYEVFTDIALAITREKQLKHWNRIWKMRLITKINPTLSDISDKLI